MKVLAKVQAKYTEAIGDQERLNVLIQIIDHQKEFDNLNNT